MGEQALKELYDLIEKESDGFRSGALIRQMELNQWVEKWTEVLDTEVTVLSKKYLTLAHEDAIRYKLATQLAERIQENCAHYKVEDHSIRARLRSFRRAKKEKRD